MAAHGLRAEIVKGGIVNGTNWALGASVFAYAEPGVKIGEEGPELYWSMTNYTLDGLSKCKDFNKDGTFRRAMYNR